MSATVEISSVIPDAQRIPAYAIEVGDHVFDASGREHRITDMKVTAPRFETPMIWIRRDDRPGYWEPWVFIDEEVTIRPSLEARS